MRLGDLDALKVVYQKWMSELDENNPEYKDERNAILSCICQLEDQPSVDIESLFIVQQLLIELKRVVNERNGLAAIVYQKCNKDCFSYNNGVIKANSGCGYFNNLTRKCMLQEWTGCKNASENVRLKEPEDYFIAKAKGGK